MVAADGNTNYTITTTPSWSTLQTALTNETDYELTDNILAGSNDTYRLVHDGVSVTLILNGYTILTIIGGTITGGNDRDNFVLLETNKGEVKMVAS